MLYTTHVVVVETKKKGKRRRERLHGDGVMEGGQWDLHIYMSWYREKERGRWVDEQGGIEYSSTFGLESRI